MSGCEFTDTGCWLGCCVALHVDVQPKTIQVSLVLWWQVEQDRFTVKPFSMGQQSDPEKYERTSTMAVRHKTVERNYSVSAFQPSK